MNTETIGEFIAALRKKKGLTQAELAKQLNVSDKAVSKWESGKGLPEVSTIPDLCKILGVTADELLAGKVKTVKSEEYESIFDKIADNATDLVSEIENGLKPDSLDEYGHSLADYCVKRNNIELFQNLLKLNIVKITDKIEDIAHKEKKNYDEEPIYCFLIRNHQLNYLKALQFSRRHYNAEELAVIVDEYNFYKEYFIREDFPAYFGAIICALVERDLERDALELLEAAHAYKDLIQNKYREFAANVQRPYEPKINYDWQHNIVAVASVYSFLPGGRRAERSEVLGKSIYFSNEELQRIAIKSVGFLDKCRQFGYSVHLTVDFVSLLLKTDNLDVFKAVWDGRKKFGEIGKLILPTNSKIKNWYCDQIENWDINEVMVQDTKLCIRILSNPKAVLQYSKTVSFDLLGKKEYLQFLKRFVPFFDRDQLDEILNQHMETDNFKAQMLLIEAGAMLISKESGEDGWGYPYSNTYRDELKTKAHYETIKKL